MFLEVFATQYTCLKMACNVKTTGRRAKQSEICDLWVVLEHMWDTFDLLQFKVILGSFSALPQNGM